MNRSSPLLARVIFISFLFAVFGLTTPCGAVIIEWDGTTGPFSDPLNWFGDVAPVAGDEARINNGGTAQLTGAQSLLFLVLGQATGQTGNLVMSAGSTLTTTSDIRMGNGGFGTGGSGVFTQTGGDIIMSGGNMNVGLGETSVGAYNLSGGTIAINSANIFAVGNRGVGTVNQSGGSVYVRGPIAPSGTTGLGQLNLGRNGAVAANNLGTASGSYTLSGGDFTAAQLRYGNNAAGAAGGSTNVFNLQGTGLLVAGTIATINNNASNSFNFTGGTLKTTTVGMPITNNGGMLSPATLVFGSATVPAPATAAGVETSPVGTTTFTLGNAYNQGSGGTLAIDLAAPGSNDFVNIGADPLFFVTANIGGTIKVNSLFEPVVGSAFDILSADDVFNTAGVIGQTPGGNSFLASVVLGGDGRDVLRLTVVPEPNAALMLIGSFGALLGAQRFRRRY